MRWPPLARRREVWVPTASGWLVMLGVISTAAALAICSLYDFLALNEPVGAKVLVVEGWMAPQELQQAVDRFKRGGYERAITTGGPLPRWFEEEDAGSFAERAREFLVARGVPPEAVVAVHLPRMPIRNRTYLSALAVKQWTQDQGVTLRALEVMSAGAHARRSRFLYEVAFGSSVRVGCFAADPVEYDPGTWWLSSAGAGDVVEQLIAFAWVKAFFWPAERFR
ncbi:MAG TPA: hypothetical protein VG873_08905 [Burkholderiales bacterium]|nr:hypothetical protein [Burkholderiales bacterium]